MVVPIAYRQDFPGLYATLFERVLDMSFVPESTKDESRVWGVRDRNLE